MKTNKNAMELGVEVLGWTPEPEKYLNDNIHPCVRYIPTGLNGHKWWMVTTPILGGTSTENPILYWGDSREGELPPLTWSGGTIVEDTPPPPGGYNSDACIFYDGVGLWVLWRENHTSSIVEGDRATFGKYTTDGITFTEKKLFALNNFSIPEKTGDTEMCPIVVNFDGTIKLFGGHYEFTPNRHPYGLAIWDIAENDMVNNQFTLTKTVGQLYKEGFNFWHFDLFKDGANYYCVASPESGAEILLGVSDDCENFKFWSVPLLSREIAGAIYFYKPTAMVHQDILYVWHPVRIDGRARIFMTQKPFTEVLTILNSSISTLS